MPIVVVKQLVVLGNRERRAGLVWVAGPQSVLNVGRYPERTCYAYANGKISGRDVTIARGYSKVYVL